MKRKKQIYKKITDLNVIMTMYDNIIRKNTKNKQKIEEFENFYSQNMVEIKDVLASKKYAPNNYSVFLIREPKLRVIMSQDIKDKIVNHLVAKYLLIDSFDHMLIDTNIATRTNKGTHLGLRLLKKYLTIMKNKYDRFYILKFDISKYFYNIDHKIVKEKLKNIIKDNDALNIIYQIVDSTNDEYINESITRLKEKEIDKIKKMNINDKEQRIKEVLKIPVYEKDKGLPIGNMTSQVIATFYLNELDHYIKEKLKLKYYIRYMDDGIILHHDKNYLKSCLIEIETIVSKYNLHLNKKTKIYSSKEPFDFLGFNFYIRKSLIMKVKNQTKKKFKRKMKKLNYLYKNNMIDYEKLRCVRDSYIGHLSYGDCKSLIKHNSKTAG